MSAKEHSNLLKGASIIISLFALGVSIRSCVLSEHSIEIVNRPYITLRPIKIEDTDAFLKATPDYNNLFFFIKVSFEMINLGKTPARDVSTPEKATLSLPGANIVLAMPFNYLPAPIINVGPGETQKMMQELRLGMKSRKEISETIELINSGTGCVTTEIPINYSNMIDSSKQYHTMVSYKICKNTALFLKSTID